MTIEDAFGYFSLMTSLTATVGNVSLVIAPPAVVTFLPSIPTRMLLVLISSQVMVSSASRVLMRVLLISRRPEKDSRLIRLSIFWANSAFGQLATHQRGPGTPVTGVLSAT